MSNSGKIYWFGTYIYTAFGNQIESTDTENPFRYCGEYYDSETGLTYLRNRYYNSATGRFLNEDPIKDGLNWYVYCNSNPVMNVDPSGLVDVPDDGAKSYNELIAALLEMIDAKTNYINENAKGEKKNQDLLNKFHKDAEHTREAKIKLNKALWYSDALKDVIYEVVLKNEDSGSVQELSSIIALAMELRYKITSSFGVDIGDEIMSEDDVWGNYMKYRMGHKVYMTDSTIYPMSGAKLAEKILSKGFHVDYYMGELTYRGNNGYGQYYDVIMLSGGAATFFEADQWPLNRI